MFISGWTENKIEWSMNLSDSMQILIRSRRRALRRIRALYLSRSKHLEAGSHAYIQAQAIYKSCDSVLLHLTSIARLTTGRFETVAIIDLAAKCVYDNRNVTLRDWLSTLRSQAIDEGIPFKQLQLAIPVLLMQLFHTWSTSLTGTTTIEDSAPLAKSLLSFGSESSWAKKTGTLSCFERMLESDPVGLYSPMTERSKLVYRSAIAEFAVELGCAERAVAEEALLLAREAHAGKSPFFSCHIGYYLVDQGRTLLDAHFRKRPEPAAMSPVVRLIMFSVLGALAFCAIPAILLFHASHLSATVIPLLSGFFLLSMPAAHFYLDQLRAEVRVPFSPLRFAPSLSLAHVRVVVAIPCILSNESKVISLLDSIRRLSSSTGRANTVYVLLSDFPDGSEANQPVLEQLLEQVRYGVTQLNNNSANLACFLLLHRDLVFSATQQDYIGWERKRGKLQQLNTAILAKDFTPFSTIAGDTTLLQSVKYVFVADDDTQLTDTTLETLLATLEHPLNHPRVNSNGSISGGYTIAQPLFTQPSLRRDEIRRRHTLTWTRSGGMPRRVRPAILYRHPQANAITCLQAAVGESHFGGKGLYNVRSFHKLTAEQVPADSVLSHDTLEGALTRTCYVFDAVAVEGGPPSYYAESEREHRWIRGDWQNLPFVVPRAGRTRFRIPHLSLVGKWFISEKIILSLSEIAFVAVIVCATSYPPSIAAFVLALVLVISLTPLIHCSISLVAYRSGRNRSISRSLWLRAVVTFLLDLGLEMAFSLQRSLVICDAIVTTLFRLVSRRGLLDWTSSALFSVSDKLAVRSRNYMRLSVSLAVLFTCFLATCRPPAILGMTAPFLAAWLVAPFLADLYVSSTAPIGFHSQAAPK